MLARAPLKDNSANRTKVHSTRKAKVTNMKAARLLKSIDALPQDRNESRVELDRREENPAQSWPKPKAEAEFTAPAEDFAPAQPLRRWGINE